ncbi:MAG: DNA translocase FtsK [Leptospiraceae bacterium]|nr:DNA translocase FtsK [Leptospiraceae bacterium]MDW7975023.1 DNA translocase FtsK [Leptospiraceae bacterium]
MILWEKFLSEIASKTKSGDITSRVFQFLFFFVGLLLLIGNFFLNNDLSLQEHSGIVGYFINRILYDLFGTLSFLIGPFFILISIRSYLLSQLEVLKNGFVGTLLFLIFGSALMKVFGWENHGFIGLHLYNLGSFLFGKLGFVFFAFFFFGLGVSYLFFRSLPSLNWKSFWKLIAQKFENKDFVWLKNLLFRPQDFKFQTLRDTNKNLPENQENQVRKEKKTFFDWEIKSEQTESRSENILQDLIPLEELNQEEEIEITREIDNENKSQDSKTTKTKNEIQEFNQNVVQALSTNATNKNEMNKNSKENLNYSAMVSKNTTDNINDDEKHPMKSFYVIFDPEKDRFVFTTKKLSFHYDENSITKFFDDIDFDSELNFMITTLPKHRDLKQEFTNQKIETKPVSTQIVAKEKVQDKNVQNDQTNKSYETQKEVISLSSELEPANAKNIFLEESNQTEAIIEVPVPIEIKSEKELAKPNQLENIQQKIKELQSRILSSEKLNSIYKLSLQSLKKMETSSLFSLEFQHEVQENWKKLEQVLMDYGIKGQVVGATRGPMITMYEVRLEPGVRVSRILGIQDEIRMNLAAHSVRIVAPIPGKSTIGIEIPNRTREFVSLSELIQKDSEFFSKKRDINIPLGKDVLGKTRYIDLTRLPHLLIAGATGSGKSVFLNSIIASLLFQYSPEYIRFLMIDPKMVELKLYEGIPHLLYPVIIDVKLAEKALHWAVEEMENRYKLFSLMKCRDIRSYNEKIQKGTIKGRIIPYIVIIIDELSDLMMVAPKEVEESMIRLTQKARAVGIHMILATQRPSVDVITALIKANCPARISFQVAQKVDSRIILDANGAETLLGKGDMLYRSPASTTPIRVQAPNITEEEIDSIVKETQKYDAGEFIELPDTNPEEVIDDIQSIDEELIDKAWKIITETGKTSISYIQRRLRIGYNRAANIIEHLEKIGYLSPPVGNKPREILKRD